MNMRPEEIEQSSMRIIEKELAEQGYSIQPGIAPVVTRVIHTTADFDFADALAFSPRAVEAGVEALARGVSLVTDTQMAAAGINKKRIEQNGGTVRCHIADEDVAIMAREREVTRALVSMERAVDETPDAVFVIGNAPTALLRLCELIGEGKAEPALVIGVPVGFVNVVESKEILMKINCVPWITARGRKGGSSVAAAIVNSLLLLGK